MKSNAVSFANQNPGKSGIQAVRVLMIDLAARLLLLTRKPGRGEGWEIGISGSIEPIDPTPQSCAQRETQEELGQHCPPLSHLCDYPAGDRLIRAYTADFNSTLLLRLEPELAGVRWIPLGMAASVQYRFAELRDLLPLVLRRFSLDWAPLRPFLAEVPA